MAPEELNKSNSFPPYSQMIMEALDALKQAEGANKSSISRFIESKYGEMPPGHAELLSHHLTRMKDSGELVFIKNNYLKSGSDIPLKRRGRPPKPKETIPSSSPPKPRGRPRKDPSEPPAPKKLKPPSSPPSISKPRKPRGRAKKVNPRPLQNGVEA